MKGARLRGRLDVEDDRWHFLDGLEENITVERNKDRAMGKRAKRQAARRAELERLRTRHQEPANPNKRLDASTKRVVVEVREHAAAVDRQQRAGEALRYGESSGRRLKPGVCLRCGNLLSVRPTGRPAVWCSQACRRAAYEERKVAANGAIAVQVLERVENVEHGLSQCVERVTASPAACRRVLQALAELARTGVLEHDSKWDATLAQARALGAEIAARPRSNSRRVP